jgi:hypothetical protein
VSGKRRRKPIGPKSYYRLDEVKQLVRTGNYIIRSNVFLTAYADFGWGRADIEDAILRLQRKNFYKAEQSKVSRRTVLDYYKAYGLKNEDVYLHFYIDDDKGELVINSLKRI